VVVCANSLFAAIMMVVVVVVVVVDAVRFQWR
jgi:hypothetical protein